MEVDIESPKQPHSQAVIKFMPKEGRPLPYRPSLPLPLNWNVDRVVLL